jgi:hypothetical protein
MKAFRSPYVKEMVEAYHRVMAVGMKKIQIRNTGVFVRTREDQEYLMNNVDEVVY